MNHPRRAPRKGMFRDIHAIYDLVETIPGLPWPTVSPARATFDYRHITHAEDARESVDSAATVLGYVFEVTFTPETETAGDGTPRYLRVALLDSGLSLVLISRFAEVTDADERLPELAVAS